MALYRNTFRIESARWQEWDYSLEGSYFITICTHHKKCTLGFVRESGVELTVLGRIVETELLRSFKMRKELFCHHYVIMPNHLHILVTIAASNPTVMSEREKMSGMRARSVSSFVCGFKSSVTSKTLKLGRSGEGKIWQALFHDHVVRDQQEFDSISEYIKNNPENWFRDRFHKPGFYRGENE